MTQPPTFDGQRWSNAEADRIELAEANPDWPRRFAEEAGAIASALSLPGLKIEHFGSTAVPGLKAKPIIDILLLPPPDADWQAWSPRWKPSATNTGATTRRRSGCSSSRACRPRARAEPTTSTS